MAHAASNHPGEPRIVIDLAETMKMPEPIIDPTTIIVASIRPRPRTKRVASVGACLAGGSISVFPPQRWSKNFSVSSERADDMPIGTKDQTLECAGRAQRRRRFGSNLDNA